MPDNPPPPVILPVVPPPNPSEEEGPIEGGDIVGVDKETIGTKPSHREQTAKTFTLTLLGIFAGALLLHYVALLLVLSWHDEGAAEIIEKQFNAWLPVLSGLVGSAATYYLTRQKS